jgi:hypothetical protein
MTCDKTALLDRELIPGLPHRLNWGINVLQHYDGKLESKMVKDYD